METMFKGIFDLEKAAREAGATGGDLDVLKTLSINQYIKVKSKEDLMDELGDITKMFGMKAKYVDFFCNRRIRINEVIFDKIQADIAYIADISIDLGGGRRTTIALHRSVVEPVRKIERKENVKGFSLLGKEGSKEIFDKMKSLVNKEVFRALMNMGASHGEEKTEVSEKQLEKYLNMWAESKYPYFLMFGEKLVIEHPIDYKITQKDMDLLVSDLMKKFPNYSAFLMELQDSMLENICKPNPLLKMYFFKEFKEGMKVSKFLSTILQDSKFDIELSKVLQHRTEKGFIKISIDPCDFLTMSVNKHNWSSCHNVYGGAWSNASFSLMCDNSTIIVFKDDGKQYEYSGKGSSWNTCGQTFKWNSKQCRELVNLDVATCALSFNKTYPDMSKEMVGSIREMMEKLVSEYVGAENCWDTYKDEEGIPRRKIKGKFHYKDPVTYQSFLKNNPRNYMTEFSTGCSVLPCPICGKEMHGTEVRGRMICSNCESELLRKRLGDIEDAPEPVAL